MELEELKNTWTALDNKLGKKEILNDRIVKEIVQSNTHKALNLLNRYEFFSAMLCFIALPFLVFMFGRVIRTLWVDVMVYSFLVLIFILCITQSCKLWLLWRIDLNSSVSENIKHFRKYQLFIQREKMSHYISIPVLFTIIIIAFLSTGQIELWRWVAIISAMISSILITVWQYKTIYGTKIRAIKKNLDELKELEEETE